MQTFLSKIDCKYGAPMGRASYGPTLSGKVRLERVYLNSGGYDSGGAYWGTGAPLYCASDSDGNQKFMRASKREAAKLMLPGCKFYR